MRRLKSLVDGALGMGAPIPHKELMNKARIREMYDQMGIREDVGFSVTPPKKEGTWFGRLLYGPQGKRYN